MPYKTPPKKKFINWTVGIDTPGPTLPNYTFSKKATPDYSSQIPRSQGPMSPTQLAPTNYKNIVSRSSSSSGSSGNSGIPGDTPVGIPGYDLLTADLTKNPYPAAYDQLLEFVKSSIGARSADFDATKGVMGSQQNTANQQMYDAYMGSRAQSDASSTALGVDPLMVSAARDLAMRKSQENSDQSLADNLAWVDKAKLLQGDELGFTSRSIAADKLNKSLGWEGAETQRVADINARGQEAYQKALLLALENQGSAQKSSREASSKSASDAAANAPKVTITEILENSGLDLATFLEMQRTDPEGAATFQNYNNQSTSTESAASLAQKAINELSGPSLRKNVPTNRWNPYQQIIENSKRTAAAKARKEKEIIERVLPKLMGISGKSGSPKSETKIVTKS